MKNLKQIFFYSGMVAKGLIIIAGALMFYGILITVKILDPTWVINLINK